MADVRFLWHAGFLVLLQRLSQQTPHHLELVVILPV